MGGAGVQPANRKKKSDVPVRISTIPRTSPDKAVPHLLERLKVVKVEPCMTKEMMMQLKEVKLQKDSTLLWEKTMPHLVHIRVYTERYLRPQQGKRYCCKLRTWIIKQLCAPHLCQHMNDVLVAKQKNNQIMSVLAVSTQSDRSRFLLRIKADRSLV